MPRVIEEQAHIPEVKPGLYQARISNIEERWGVDTKFGPKDVLVVSFMLKDKKGEIVELKKRYNRTINERLSFYKLVRDVTTKSPKGSYDIDELLNERCQILVSNNDDEIGNTWANIDKVLAYDIEVAVPDDDLSED